MRCFLRSAALGSAALFFSCCAAHTAFAEEAAALVHDAAYNEAHAHTINGGWVYKVQKRVDGRLLTEEQVDTPEGPVYRVLAIDGHPLTAEQRQKESAREQALLNNPGLEAKAKKQYESDERQLQALLQLLPRAFVFQEKSETGKYEVLTFRPNPAFHPDGYVQRVMQALEGEIVIDLQDKRIAHMSGRVVHPVEFGFGILGRIDPGGTFEIGRSEIAPDLWKTTLIDIDVSGRFSFFATITKQEYELRSDFHRVLEGLSVRQAFQLLDNTP
jgi:hypothetical protein